MPKKRKLNSKNPKYLRNVEKDIKVRRELACEAKGCKVYKVYSL
tara:strand:+ start:731 stop:862 length:132 start_codon:yes stop_codon:yes gene_type:complete